MILHCVVLVGSTAKSRWACLTRAAERSEAFEADSSFVAGQPLTYHCLLPRRILRTLCASLLISKDIDFKSLAKATPGYVGADLASLTSAAGVVAVKRMFRELSSIEGQVRLGVEGLDVGGSSAGPSGASIEGEEETDGMAIDGEMDVTTLDTPATPGGAGLSGPELTPSTSAAPSAATSTPASPTALSSALMAPAVQPSSTGLFATLPESLLKTPIASFLLSHQKALPDALLSNLALLPPDFASALKTTQPSSQREGFATIPSVTWSDIGALETIRDELHMAIVQPIRRPELFRRVGIEAPGGVLLWGPPGCGKTLLAKAVANESRANFISVKGPEVLNKVHLLVDQVCPLKNIGSLTILPRLSSIALSMLERVSAQSGRYLRGQGPRRRVSSSSMSWMHSFRAVTMARCVGVLFQCQSTHQC